MSSPNWNSPVTATITTKSVVGDISKIDKEIETFANRIADLKLRKEALQSLRTEQQIAIILHQLNPVRGDDAWDYERVNGLDEWSGNEHTFYVRKAAQLLKIEPDPVKLEQILIVAKR